MNTKILMMSSALFLGIIGILLTFLPEEIASYLNTKSNMVTVLFLKLLGALYFGFGILNWTAKGTLIGGIYNRPISIANLAHFGIGAITLVKVVSHIQNNSEIIIPLMAVYAIFGILFAIVFRTNPAKIEKQ